MAILIAGAAVLVCGDYLSPVEIPWISEDGSLDAYLATLERLRPLVERVENVVPGHGSPRDREGALRLLDEDVRYLLRLREAGARARLPPGRVTSAQKRIHRENVDRVGV